MVAAEVDVHQAGDARGRVGVRVVVHALHERRGAVPHADDGDTDLTHGGSFSLSVLVCRDRLPAPSGLPGLALGGALGGDQLVEPPHLPLAGVEAELVELAGVVVDLLAGADEGGPQSLAPLLDGPPAALEDAHPRLRRGAGEEREVDAEAFVVPRLRPALGQHLGEPVLALGVIRYTRLLRRGQLPGSGAGCSGSSTIRPARVRRRRAGYSEP